MTIVYAGPGSSHSWTWLADIFESRQIHDVRFTDAGGLTESLGEGVSRVIISGGDGLGIATSIGQHGFAHLKGYIHRGGGYVGMCAGAYLPLHSSIAPFDQFNISKTKIENIRPEEVAPGTSPRVAVRYSTCSIVHPVRGEVEVQLGGRRLLAPLYGGPIFREPEEDQVVLRYSGLTKSTEYQSEEVRARALVIGRPAGITCNHGKGGLVLLGPHLEHPRYQEANDVFLELIGMRTDGSERVELSHLERDFDSHLVKSISDLKVAILGLENRSFLVGDKLWDGGRFLELVDAIEKRAHTLDDKLAGEIAVSIDLMRELLVNSSDSSFEDSLEGPDLLVGAARKCVDNHFAYLRGNR